jgi:hypothetical protein
MYVYLLDAGGPALLLIPLVFFMVVCGLVEGLVLFLFKAGNYGQTLGIALVANLVSLVLGFIIWNALPTDPDVESLSEVLLSYALLWAISVVSEALIIKLMKRSLPWRRIWTASIVMNLVTYIILYFFIDA